MNEAEQRNLNRPPVQTFQSRGLDNETRRIMQKGAAIPIYTCTKANVTSSRAFDSTVYQNTSGKIKIASITGNKALTSAGDVAFYCDSAATPTEIVGAIGVPVGSGGAGTIGLNFTFAIPAGHYYKAVPSGTTPALNYWIEWTLF